MTEPDNEEISSRRQLLRDVLVFQVKLFMDGLRDLLLSPISITAALIGFVIGGRNPGKYFYRLLEEGHKTDRWINLFNTYSTEEQPNSADKFIKTAETIVLQELQKAKAEDAAFEGRKNRSS